MWLSDSDRAKGYAVDFISISLHAVSRDPEAYHAPCIYAQVIHPWCKYSHDFFYVYLLRNSLSRSLDSGM